MNDIALQIIEDDDEDDSRSLTKLPSAKTAGRELTLAEIKFSALAAAGMDYKSAYKKLKDDPEIGEFMPSYSKLVADPAVQGYINELRVRAAREALGKTTYDIREAMAEASLAFAIASKRGDAKAMVQATMLKSKIMGLLTEDRKNERSALQDLTQEQLDAYLADLQREEAELNSRMQ